MKNRHGGPRDRGQADAYYGRPFKPHYFVGATYVSTLVTALTAEEHEEYRLGFVEQQESGEFKEWD